jgi:hypothetical protein
MPIKAGRPILTKGGIVTKAKPIEIDVNEFTDKFSKTAFVLHDKTAIQGIGFSPPLDLPLPGESEKIYHVHIADVPAWERLQVVLANYRETEISPVCFWLDWKDLGPGKRVRGEGLTLEQAVERYGLGVDVPALQQACRRGQLPGYLVPADPNPKRYGGHPKWKVNTLDLEKYLSDMKTKLPAKYGDVKLSGHRADLDGEPREGKLK